jgi:hypothetical protein
MQNGGEHTDLGGVLDSAFWFDLLWFFNVCFFCPICSQCIWFAFDYVNGIKGILCPVLSMIQIWDFAAFISTRVAQSKWVRDWEEEEDYP